MLRVLVVDPSPFMGNLVTGLIEDDQAVATVTTFQDGRPAAQALTQRRPEVLVIDPSIADVGPVIDAVASLGEHLRVVTLSADPGSLPAAWLELPAVAVGGVIEKPSGSVSLDISRVESDLLAAVTGRTRRAEAPPATDVGELRVVAIAASTGGPKALEVVLRDLPRDLPAAVLIVQHMPPRFTNTLAQRLDEVSSLTVREAKGGEILRAGEALFAPGDYHITVSSLRRNGSQLALRLNQDPKVNSVRPSADVLFFSVARECGARAVGVVLTGIGADGACGARAIKNAGGTVVVQDETTSVVYGMPQSTIHLSAADQVLPLTEIAPFVTRLLQDTSSGRARTAPRSRAR